MQGKRRDLDNDNEILEPGEYGYHKDHRLKRDFMPAWAI